MNKIAVIGGSGFIGTKLISLLMDSDYEVVNVDKVPSSKHGGITQIADIRHKESFKPLLKNCDSVILLAAEHRDDVSPNSLYYDVNVRGTQNVLDAMDELGIKNIFFTSSVAVYGLNKDKPNENHLVDPFKHYGKSKWKAEEVLTKWQKSSNDKVLNIIRPTVVFGENNRGNVYNLLSQIASGKFMMIGNGQNKKSMCYVRNVISFIKFCMENNKQGINIYNYIDKPDLTMTELVNIIGGYMGKPISNIKIPYYLGMLAGYGFDLLSFVTRKKLPVSSVRIKKFCATTVFCADKIKNTGYEAPYTLEQALQQTIKSEFINDK